MNQTADQLMCGALSDDLMKDRLCIDSPKMCPGEEETDRMAAEGFRHKKVLLCFQIFSVKRRAKWSKL
jgi:hypothetical protein